MPVRTISTKLVIEGENEYKAAISGINGELKLQASNLKLVEASFAGQANSMEALKAKGIALNGMYSAQQQKIQELKSYLDATKTAQTAYGSKLEEAKTKVSATEAALNKLKNSTGDTTAAEKKLSAELAKQKLDLDNAAVVYNKAGNKVNNLQTQLNEAQITSKSFGNEIKKNSKYVEEAARSTDKCATSIDRFGKETQQAAEKSGLLQKIFAGGFLANIATQALSAVVGKVKQLATAAFDTADELEKLSSQTGLSTSKLQQMSYIGDDLGVSLEVQSGALRKLIRNMASAQAGTGDAAKAFKTLKLDVVDGNGKLIDSNIIYGKVIDALGKMTNETERDATAQKIFGKSAADLNPLIEAGSEALKDLADNAESAGAIMSEEAVGALDATGDAFDHFKQSAKAFVGEGLVSIIGSGKTVAETMTELQSSFAKNDSVQRLIDKFRSLSQEVAGSALSSGELSEKSKELEQTKQDLIAASGGVVTAFDIENGTFDKQVTSLAGATEAEREYLTLKLKAVAIENTGVNAKRAAEKAQKELAAATARRDAEQAKNDRLKGSSKNGTRIENMIESSTTRLGIYQQQVADANIAISDLGTSAMSGAEAIRQLSRAGVDSGEMAKEFGLSLEDVEAIISGTGDATEKAIPEINDMSTAIALLNENYEAAYTSALESLNGQIGMWDTMTNSIKVSIADLQAALDSQKQWYTDYTTNLETIMAVEIPGIDMQPILDSISEGTPQAAERAAALANAITSGNSEAVAKLAGDISGLAVQKEQLATIMAEAVTDYDSNMKNIVESTASSVKEMDKSGEAKTSGANTIQGYINGVVSKGKTLNATMARVANNAMAAWKRAFEEKSPSKVMEKSGENAILGDIKGVENMQNKLNKTYAETASMAQRSYDNATPASISVISDSSSRQTVNHTGTIRVQGVSSAGETLAVADIVMEQLRREARM